MRIMFAARVGMLVFRPVRMEPIADFFGYGLHTQILRGVCLVSSAADTLNINRYEPQYTAPEGCVFVEGKRAP